MYYPFFRGKQFELLLLRDKSTFIAQNNIHPIIEPVKDDFTAIVKAFTALSKANAPATLIINPKTGQAPVTMSSITEDLLDEQLKGFENISIGYLLDSEASVGELMQLLGRYTDRRFSLIHCGYSEGKHLANMIAEHSNIYRHIFIDGSSPGKLYQRQFKQDGIERVLIRNGFKSRQKNADYPPHEHFSELHLTYRDEGMDGFGDYLTVGDDYTETGGPAYAVAIHLTYVKDDDMFIYHFISDQTDSPTDPGGKFFEALSKLVKEANKPHSFILKKDACLEFLELHKKKHYPGLGVVKKLSMYHHLELMAYCLENEK